MASIPSSSSTGMQQAWWPGDNVSQETWWASGGWSNWQSKAWKSDQEWAWKDSDDDYHQGRPIQWPNLGAGPVNVPPPISAQQKADESSAFWLHEVEVRQRNAGLTPYEKHQLETTFKNNKMFVAKIVRDFGHSIGPTNAAKSLLEMIDREKNFTLGQAWSWYTFESNGLNLFVLIRIPLSIYGCGL